MASEWKKALTDDEWKKLISAAYTGKDGEGEGQVVEAIIDKLLKALVA